jgi:predicted alpha/beta hydrolase family esterase
MQGAAGEEVSCGGARLMSSAARTPVLIVPGWGNSDSAHWQTLWQANAPDWERVMQRDWERPNAVDWLAAIDAKVSGCAAKPVLVGHSLGSIAIVKWAAIRKGRAAGAFLVAPVDVEAYACPPELRPFAPIPGRPIPFPVQVVASHDDPYVSVVRAAEFARRWGAAFSDIGSAGHINSDSGHGAWPEGRALLEQLLARVAARP